MQESAILCSISLLLSLFLLQLGLPWFNTVSGKQLLLSQVLDWRFLLNAILVVIAIIVLTGLYPAYSVSRFRPSEIFYGRQKLTGRQLFGRSLVVLQFSLAVFLLIATLVYYSQMQFIRAKHLGFNPSQIIHTKVEGDRDYKSVMTFLKNELSKDPAISQVSLGNDGWKEAVQANGRVLDVQYKNIDEQYLSMMEIPLVAGRNLSPRFSTDITERVLVNETFLKAAGITDPIGKRIKVSAEGSTFKTIQGVVKDFHFGSLREPIAPMLLYMREWPDGGVWVKFETSKQKNALAALERIYRQAIPDAVYEYGFLDESIARQYTQEVRWQQVVSIATVVSFVICCLGLFGLAHLAAHQRIKEIGIRKTLGASVASITALLSKDFLKLVLVALLIASPVAWWALHNWLQNYAYRIEIGWQFFVAAGMLSLLIAVLTVGYQAIKAATSNPVKSLRTE
jgi:putative ABC transport system permease protein